AIDEQVRAEVTGYMRRNTTEKISFEEWNGDLLAEVVLDGILREDLLPTSLRSHLRKAVAMVEEPDIALKHFRQLLGVLVANPGDQPAKRLSQARLINICVWIIFVWAREAGNVEAPYRASEWAMLSVWHLLRHDIIKSDRNAERASFI
ncbi:chemotaxis protein, partial [Rhizobium leguminosarum]|nr:chemotaxis protein [Rhizobium leguminosarum]